MNQILIEIWVVCTTLSVLTRATDVDFIKELVVNSTKGVKEVKNGYCQDIPCFYLRRPFNDVVLPRTESESFISSLNRNQALSARFLFKQSKIKRQVSTLFSINVPGRMSPEMRLTLSPAKKRLVVYYNSSSNGRTHHKGVYLNHHAVFEWMHVFVAFTPDSLKIYVNYDIGLTMKIRDGVNLNFSGDSLIYFRQEPGLKRQFIGKIQVAKLSASKNFKIPWKCYEENRELTNV